MINAGSCGAWCPPAQSRGLSAPNSNSYSNSSNNNNNDNDNDNTNNNHNNNDNNNNASSASVKLSGWSRARGLARPSDEPKR